MDLPRSWMEFYSIMGGPRALAEKAPAVLMDNREAELLIDITEEEIKEFCGADIEPFSLDYNMKKIMLLAYTAGYMKGRAHAQQEAIWEKRK